MTRHFVQVTIEIPTPYRTEDDAQRKARVIIEHVKKNFPNAEASVSIWESEIS